MKSAMSALTSRPDGFKRRLDEGEGEKAHAGLEAVERPWNRLAMAEAGSLQASRVGFDLGSDGDLSESLLGEGRQSNPALAENRIGVDWRMGS